MIPIALRILAIFLMIGAGWVARRRGIIDADTTRNLSRLLTTCFYPALILTSMTRNFTLQGLASNWQLPVGAFGIMLTGFCIGLLVERLLTDPHSREGHAFLFQCTINNYSFLPMPLALMFWGEAAVAALIFSSLGPEIAMWTLGVYALSGRRLQRSSLRQLASPPLMAIAAALTILTLRALLPALEEALPLHARHAIGSIFSAATLFGGATIPVAMIVAGSRMAGLTPGHIFSRIQLAVSAIRLLVIPALVIPLILVLPLTPETTRILILVAVMPSAVTSVILSELYRADSRFAASSVLITHLLCLLTIPVWLYLLFRTG